MTTKIRAFLSLAMFFSVLCISVYAEPVPAAIGDKDLKDITNKVYPSVVKVEARNGWAKVATGVVIDKDGHIVTTALITPRDEELYVITSEGERIEAEFIGMDAMTHLAVVKAKMKKSMPVTMGESETLDTGSWIGVVGISPEEKPMITQGIVSSIASDTLRLNVWVVPGASGAPVVDENGRMVGLIRGAYADSVVMMEGQIVAGRDYFFSRAEAPSSGMAQAIPIHIVKKVSSEIKEKGKVERGWLGISIVDADEDGVEIMSVDPDSPAEKAELEEGDIILEFDGRKITGGKMLVDEIRMHQPEDKVKLKIKRDGKTMDVTVELGEYSRNVIIREFETKFPRLFPRDEERLEERFAFPREVTPESFFPRRKYIGVYLDELNEELAKYFGAEEGTGLLITKLTKDGPAEKAGLRVGDVIVKADGERVKSLQDLTRQIHKKDKNEEIEIEYIRDKKKNTVKVKVDEEKDQGVFFVPSERSRIGIVTDEPFFSPRYKYEDRLKSQSEKQFLYEDVFKNILDKSQKKLYRLQEEQGDSYRKLFEDFSKMNGGSPEKSYTQAMKWYRGIIV